MFPVLVFVGSTCPSSQENLMTRFLIRMCGAVVVCGSLLSTVPARGDERPAEAILAEIDAVKTPSFDSSKQKDSAYVQQYIKEQSSSSKRKAALIGELLRTHPDNPRLAQLLPLRWQAMSTSNPADMMEMMNELNGLVVNGKTEKSKTDAAYWKARVASNFYRGDDEKIQAAIDEFLAFAPKDTRGASLLMMAGSGFRNDPARQKAIYEKIASLYPGTAAANSAQGSLRRIDAVGKPLELAFTDAVTGSEVSIKGLKGKVVVLDFWATWCGPCVAEMPTMKKLYSEYKDKGVEFIGVSLDEKAGGLDKLKEFVAKEGITWPQYYQGDGWNSEFSRSWGINSIPAVFVVDQEGNISSVEARGKLDKMIPELLKKAKTGAGAGAGGQD